MNRPVPIDGETTRGHEPGVAREEPAAGVTGVAAGTGATGGTGGTGRRWVDRLDRWCERVGDSVNPILVKETRQALKSRQFVVTFSMVLVAALGWTVIGSLMLMPEIYTTPSAPRMLGGYFLLLAVPMLLVVPLAAYRSMESEIDDGTFELLTITSLSPRQIVWGKLSSAMLQMLLYFIALFPCVAYAYTLRGVDLPTTLLMLGVLAVTGVAMTIYAIFFAPLAHSRGGRIGTLLAVLFPLLLAEYLVGVLMLTMLQRGNPLGGELTLFMVAFVVLHTVTIGHLLLTATAAQLTPESENRSTGLRVGLLTLTSVSVGLVGYALATFDRAPEWCFVPTLCMLGTLWIIAGALLAAESPSLTPRVRRELPSSFAARMLFTFLTPGPSTGLVFACVGGGVTAFAGYLGVEYLRGKVGTSSYTARWLDQLVPLLLLVPSYLIGLLVGVRWVVAIARVNNHPRVEIGIAALAAIAVLTALIPYSFGLHFNGYQTFPYSAWQTTNWAWTLSEAKEGNLSLVHQASVAAAAAALLLLHVVLVSPAVLPRRIATPQRVRVEQERAATSR